MAKKHIFHIVSTKEMWSNFTNNIIFSQNIHNKKSNSFWILLGSHTKCIISNWEEGCWPHQHVHLCNNETVASNSRPITFARIAKLNNKVEELKFGNPNNDRSSITTSSYYVLKISFFYLFIESHCFKSEIFRALYLRITLKYCKLQEIYYCGRLYIILYSNVHTQVRFSSI